MISTVFRKSTVRPCESVSRPSSSTCSSVLKTSGWAFSISSSSTTEYGPTADLLGELAGLAVPDVAGGRSDEPRDGVPLGELAHVDADHAVLVAEHLRGQGLGQLGLADAGRAEEQEAADRTVRVTQAGPRAAHGLGDRRDGVVLADHTLVQLLLEREQAVPLGLGELADRDAGRARDDLGDVLDGHLEHAGLPGTTVGAGLLELRLGLRDLVAQGAGPLVVLVRDGLVLVALQRLELALELARVGVRTLGPQPLARARTGRRGRSPCRAGTGR